MNHNCDITEVCIVLFVSINVAKTKEKKEEEEEKETEGAEEEKMGKESHVVSLTFLSAYYRVQRGKVIIT